MLSPVAGLDRQMLFDTRPLAQQVLQSLETTPRFHQLSAKFAVQLDGGEALAMLEHPHDLWLSPLKLDDELWLAFGLAGCPAADAPLGAVPLTRGHELVLAVLKRFLDLARPEQTRMRQLLSEHTPEAFIAGLVLPVRADAAVCQWRRSPVTAGYLGIYPQLQHGLSAVGSAAPLGRLNPSMLRAAARLAREQGDGTLRMTLGRACCCPTLATIMPGKWSTAWPDWGCWSRPMIDWRAWSPAPVAPAAPKARPKPRRCAPAGHHAGTRSTGQRALERLPALVRHGPRGARHLAGAKPRPLRLVPA